MMDLQVTEIMLSPEERDLVIAHASGRIGAATFDRYRATCERANGSIHDAVWSAVIATLSTRAIALAV